MLTITFETKRKNFTMCIEKPYCYKTMAIIPAFQEVLEKEYGPWFFESVCNSKNFDLEVFDIFDKKNNYDGFTCS